MAEVADGSAMNSAVSVIPTLSSQVRRLAGQVKSFGLCLVFLMVSGEWNPYLWL